MYVDDKFIGGPAPITHDRPLRSAKENANNEDGNYNNRLEKLYYI